MGCREDAVLKRREVGANFSLGCRIDLGDHTAATTRESLQNAAPVVDDHAIAISFPPTGMKSGLGGSNYIAQVLNGTGAQQSLPVRAASRRREGGRNGEKLRSRGTQGTKQLREAHVVAHRKPELPHGGIHYRGARSGSHVRRLAIRLGTARNIDIEQMNLVVAPPAPTVRSINERGRGYPPIGSGTQGNGTPHNRHTQA